MFDPLLLLDALATERQLEIFEASKGRAMLGDVEAEDARDAASMLRERWMLPNPLMRVEAESVASAPLTYHGRHLEMTATWRFGFEVSSFAGAWISASPPLARRDREHPSAEILVTARGVWLAEEGRGYGHLGASDAVFHAYSVERVEGPQGGTSHRVD